MKRLLKMACDAEVGHWNGRALSLVRSLNTHANAGMARRKNTLISREELVNISLQADIVRSLDAEAWNAEVENEYLEGAAALVFIYQHGVRPVQVLCLDTEHVRFFKDANDESACIVSFHAAKQRDEQQFEIVRQVKPEWVQIVKDCGSLQILQAESDYSKQPNLRLFGRKLRLSAGVMELTWIAPLHSCVILQRSHWQMPGIVAKAFVSS